MMRRAVSFAEQNFDDFLKRESGDAQMNWCAGIVMELSFGTGIVSCGNIHDKHLMAIRWIFWKLWTLQKEKSRIIASTGAGLDLNCSSNRSSKKQEHTNKKCKLCCLRSE